MSYNTPISFKYMTLIVLTSIKGASQKLSQHVAVHDFAGYERRVILYNNADISQDMKVDVINIGY